MGKNQHVVPHGNQWQIKGDGNQKATGTFDTQREAEARAKEIAINQKSELFIHGKNGQIRAQNSYGNDPYPPKG